MKKAEKLLGLVNELADKTLQDIASKAGVSVDQVKDKADEIEKGLKKNIDPDSEPRKFFAILTSTLKKAFNVGESFSEAYGSYEEFKMIEVSEGVFLSEKDLRKKVTKAVRNLKLKADLGVVRLTEIITKELGIKKPAAERAVKIIIGQLIQQGVL